MKERGATERAPPHHPTPGRVGMRSLPLSVSETNRRRPLQLWRRVGRTLAGGPRSLLFSSPQLPRGSIIPLHLTNDSCIRVWWSHL